MNRYEQDIYDHAMQAVESLWPEDLIKMIKEWEDLVKTAKMQRDTRLARMRSIELGAMRKYYKIALKRTQAFESNDLKEELTYYGDKSQAELVRRYYSEHEIESIRDAFLSTGSEVDEETVGKLMIDAKRCDYTSGDLHDMIMYLLTDRGSARLMLKKDILGIALEDKRVMDQHEYNGSFLPDGH